MMRLRLGRALRLLKGFDRRLDLIAIGQGRLHAELIRAQGAGLAESEFGVFSQSGEDGIIQRLTQLVPIANKTFIEFGVDDFLESNCRFLMIKDNWQGMVIDGDPGNVRQIRESNYFWRHDLQAIAAFIDADNVDSLLRGSGFDEDLGLLSVDIDGNDFWVLSAIRSFRPRILIVEYNAVYGTERPISVPYAPDFVRGQAHYSNLYWGASLPAFNHWADQNGYDLVCAGSNGVNAFFVRRDVRPDAVPRRTVADAFAQSRFRDSRDSRGALSFLRGGARLEEIRGLPVTNVISGETETI